MTAGTCSAAVGYEMTPFVETHDRGDTFHAELMTAGTCSAAVGYEMTPFVETHDRWDTFHAVDHGHFFTAFRLYN